ncbi:hypothetical protein [Streptomyces sp. yara]|uniref:hypothetical protein n=1 Tax=Streptomyces sp. yara TaxID=3458421 RepID=UPI00403FD068
MGAYFVIGRGGSTRGLKHEGAHMLTTPATVLSKYTRVGKGTEDSSADKIGDLVNSGIKVGKSVGASYLTTDPQDPTMLPDQAELLTAKGVTFFGAYSKAADSEAALDEIFATLKKEAAKSNKEPMSELVGEPESVDIDGAVMKCQAGKGTNNLTKKQPTNWFCAWADYSTIAVVSPGDNTKAITKSARSGHDLQLRNFASWPDDAS